MAGVGWIIMGIGFAIQVLVPVGLFGRPTGLIFGIPTQLAFVFGGTWILVIGPDHRVQHLAYAVCQTARRERGSG